MTELDALNLELEVIRVRLLEERRAGWNEAIATVKELRWPEEYYDIHLIILDKVNALKFPESQP